MKIIISLIFFTFSFNSLCKDLNIDCKQFLLIDKSNSKKIEEIRDARDFLEIDRLKLNFGFSPSTHWIKLVCSNNSKERFEGKVIMLYPAIHRLNVYYQKNDFYQLGFEENNISLRPEFDLEIEADREREFYIESKTYGSLQMQFQITSNERLREASYQYVGWYFSFFGILISLILYNLFFGIFLFEKIYLYYSGYVISFLMYQSLISGIFPWLYGTGSSLILTYRACFIYSVYFFITLFTNEFLFFKNQKSFSRRLLIAMSILFFFMIILTPYLPLQGNFIFSALISIITPIILIFIASKKVFSGFKPARFFVLAWSFFLISIVVTALRNIGFLHKTWFVDHILEFGIITEVFLISLGIAFKMKILKTEKEYAEKKHNEKRNEIAVINNILEREKVIANLAGQVSHDIRSPLAALNMITKELDVLPESTRIILRGSITRIQDIANNLLKNNKENTDNGNDNKIDIYLLSPIIEEIISEKRTQIRSKMNMTIDSKMSESYGLFAKINQSHLKRLVSNLINNSLDAFDKNEGKIVLSLSKYDKKIIINVTDNGKGIPPHILSKLGKKGETFGKESFSNSGSGLGLYHAKTSIESWGGTFKIESKTANDNDVKSGTNIILSLPETISPKWFIPCLKITRNQTIIIIDDDSSIHQVWDKKFEEVKKDNDLKIIHFTGHSDFNDWINNNRLASKRSLFLCDYEFIGHDHNGLDLIEKNNISSNSILVTSRYEQAEVRARCEKLNVKLIPKMMVESVPLLCKIKL